MWVFRTLAERIRWVAKSRNQDVTDVVPDSGERAILPCGSAQPSVRSCSSNLPGSLEVAGGRFGCFTRMGTT